jgi:hypothetical protein
MEIKQPCFKADVYAVLYKSTYMDFQNILIEVQDLTHLYNHYYLYSDFTLTRPTEYNMDMYLVQ